LLSSDGGLSISASNPAVSLFARQVAGFLGNDDKRIIKNKTEDSDDDDESDKLEEEDEEDDSDEEQSSEKKKKPTSGSNIETINAMYHKYRKVQEKLAKAMQDGGEFDDDSGSITISKST
jgi:hypothetical protein